VSPVVWWTAGPHRKLTKRPGNCVAVHQDNGTTTHAENRDMDGRGYGVTTPGRTFVDIAAVAMQLLGFPFVHDALDHQGLEEPPMAVTQG